MTDLVAPSVVVVVGGGPAGMMAGLLFARAGVPTLVLEKHADFLRDFRGGTVHPSTLELFDELGFLEALLAREHDKVSSVGAVIGGREYRIARHPMRQWEMRLNRRICASDNQIRSLMATPPRAAIESTRNQLRKQFIRP